jgi:hypothetical protein
LPRVLRRNMSSSSSVQLPYAAAAAPPPHGEQGGQPEGACCDVLCAAPAIAIYPSPNSCSKRQFLPRAHRIETEVALRDPSNCKLFSLFCSSVYCRLLTLSVCFVCLKSGHDYIVMSSKSNQKIPHNLCTTQYSWWLQCDQST